MGAKRGILRSSLTPRPARIIHPATCGADQGRGGAPARPAARSGLRHVTGARRPGAHPAAPISRGGLGAQPPVPARPIRVATSRRSTRPRRRWATDAQGRAIPLPSHPSMSRLSATAQENFAADHTAGLGNRPQTRCSVPPNQISTSPAPTSSDLDSTAPSAPPRPQACATNVTRKKRSAETAPATRKQRSGAHGVSEREQPSDVAGLVRKPGGSRDHAPWGPGSSPRQQTRRTPEVSSSPAPTLPANAPVPVYTSYFVKILLAGRPDAVRSRERESSGEHSRRTPPRHLPSRGMSATGRRARWAPAIAWLGGCALVGSLWLPWYSAIDDGGPYVKDAWAVFSALPILLLAVAAIGMLMGPVAVAAPHRLRLLRLPGIAFSLVMAVVCTYRLLTPHDVSAANAETGAFLATGACLVITAAWFAPAARGHGTSVPRPVDRPGGP